MTMDDFTKNLDLDSDTFEEMKKNFNFVLQRLLGNMEEKRSREGSLTLKLDISLAQEFIPNFDPEIEGETREIHKPTFKHKITSIVKINDEKSGNLDSEMELYMDEDGIYKMKPIANTQQRSIFDADFREMDAESEEEGKADETALPGRKIMSLPGPSAESTSQEGSETEENAGSETSYGSDEKNAPLGDDEAESSHEDDIEPLPFSEDDEYGYEEPEEE